MIVFFFTAVFVSLLIVMNTENKATAEAEKEMKEQMLKMYWNPTDDQDELQECK